MIDPVSYALIGFGGIAEQRLAKEGFACDRTRFAPLPEARLAGAWNRSPGRRAAVEALGLTWFATLEELWQNPAIQAVFIATNNASHAELALAALAHGKHVIVEKPMATSAAIAQQIVDTARRARLSLSINHMMRHHQLNQIARSQIADGVLGEVNDGCFHMEFAYGYTPEEAASWRCAGTAELGGPIGDVGSHCFYLAEELLQQRIVRLQAAYRPKAMPTAVEDGAYIRAWFADGRAISIRVAFNERRGGALGNCSSMGYEIYGSHGVLRGVGTMGQLSGHADEPFQPRLELELDAADQVRIIRPVQPENIYQAVIRRHARAVQSGEPLYADDAVHNLMLCELAHRSAQNNGAVYPVP